MSKKIIAFALAAVFAVSMAGPARADTISDLQAQIQSLLAQITQLQQQLNAAQGGTTTTTGLCISAGLKMGMKSDAVKTLQEGLKQDPAVYPEGLTTGYFGPLTKAAVIRFQEKYASEVLAPWGLTKGTGYVGQTTAAKFNALYCTPVAPTTTTTVAPEETTTTTTVPPAYGTLSLVSYPVSNPQTTLYGGKEYEIVAGQFKATGSDITLKKVAVRIIGDTADAFPWQAFTNVALYDGSTKLADLDVNEANSIKNAYAKDYTFNISGFNWVIPKGEKKVLTVKATTVTNPVTDAQGTWTIKLLHDNLVYSDTAGVTYTTAGTDDISKTGLTISTSQNASFEVTLATDTPKAGNIIVSSTGTTKADLLKFNVKDKDVDSTLTSGSVNITVNTYGDFSTSSITSVELYDGSTLLASAVPSWSGSAGTASWDNFTLPISAGTTKALTVKVSFAQVDSGFTNDGSGYVFVSNPSLTGMDANNNLVTANTSLNGNHAYPFLVAPTFTYVSSSATVRGSDNTHTQDLGDTAITFSVTANGGDIYIPTRATLATGIDEILTNTGSSTNHAIPAEGMILFVATPTADGVATATIDGISVGYSYSPAASDTTETVANGLAAAINANSTINTKVHAAATNMSDYGIINLTAVTAGDAGNNITYSATTTANTGIAANPAIATNMEKGDNNNQFTNATTWSCESPADDTTASGYWYIPSGSTANCIFKDVATNKESIADWFKDTIFSISWNTSATTTGDIDQNWGLTNFNSDYFYLGNGEETLSGI